MRMMRYAALGALAFCLILLAVPAYAESASEPEYEMYYIDSSESGLTSRRYQPKETAPDLLLQELTTFLNSRESYSGSNPLLPEGVEMQTYSLQSGALTLNFNKTYSEIGLGREVLTRNGLVKLFTQLPQVKTVEIYVDDAPLTNSKGNRVGALTNDSFVGLASDDEDAYRYETFTLYFPDKEGEHLYAEERTVYYKRSIPKVRVALEQLINGPMEKDHYPCLADSVTVRSVTISDSACYVDLGSAFVDRSVGMPDKTVIAALVNTVIANTGVKKVEILVNGKENVNLSDETNLYNFYLWNKDLIQEEAAE